MKDTLLHNKLVKKYQALLRELDSVGPTPLRQVLDAHLVLSLNALKSFDQDAYETDTSYAKTADKAKDKANSMLPVVWS